MENQINKHKNIDCAKVITICTSFEHKNNLKLCADNFLHCLTKQQSEHTKTLAKIDKEFNEIRKHLKKIN